MPFHMAPLILLCMVAFLAILWLVEIIRQPIQILWNESSTPRIAKLRIVPIAQKSVSETGVKESLHFVSGHSVEKTNSGVPWIKSLIFVSQSRVNGTCLETDVLAVMYHWDCFGKLSVLVTGPKILLISIIDWRVVTSILLKKVLVPRRSWEKVSEIPCECVVKKLVRKLRVPCPNKHAQVLTTLKTYFISKMSHRDMMFAKIFFCKLKKKYFLQ